MSYERVLLVHPPSDAEWRVVVPHTGQAYIERRSERTKAGLARVQAKGKKLGRPKGSKDKSKRKKRISFSEYVY